MCTRLDRMKVESNRGGRFTLTIESGREIVLRIRKRVSVQSKTVFGSFFGLLCDDPYLADPIEVGAWAAFQTNLASDAVIAVAIIRR